MASSFRHFLRIGKSTFQNSQTIKKNDFLEKIVSENFFRSRTNFGASPIGSFSKRGISTAAEEVRKGQKALTGGEGEGGGGGGEGEGEGGGERRRGARQGPVTWGSLAALILTGGGLLYYYDSEKRKRIEVVRQGSPIGKAAIGGPFSLLDSSGKKVTEKDFKGVWNLIYFGFTYCPDICPEELQKMAKAVDLVEKQTGLKIRPIFISIDPERDSVEQVDLYVKEFHPSLVGLTGSVEEVRNVAREYRVYYMKTEEEGSDYLVDHSIIMYLMDPKMEFVKFFGKNYSPETLSDGIVEEIKNWKGEEGE